MISGIQPQGGLLGRTGGGLLNTASNYSYPLTSGLMSGLSQPTDWSQVALQMAGNPHAGPYASVPVPAGTPNPGASPQSGAQSAAGLLTALASNPSLLKNVTSGISNAGDAVKGLLGTGGSATGSTLGAQDPAWLANGGVTSGAGGDAGTLASAGGAGGGGGLLDASGGVTNVLGGDAATAAAPAAAAGDTSTVLAPMTGYGGSIAGANGAGTLAAGAGTDAAASGGADAAALGGGDAAGGAAAGSLGLGLLGAGAVLAPVLYGMSKPPYTLNQDYYARTGAAMGQGFQPGQSGFPILEGAVMHPGSVTQEEWNQLAQYGITPQNAQAMYQKYAQQPLAPGTPVGGGRGGAPV